MKRERSRMAKLLRDPWVRLYRASLLGRGVHLSASDVAKIAPEDHAVRAAADEYARDLGFVIQRDGTVAPDPFAEVPSDE